ncbi:MAG: hypothetical protein ACM3JP_01155 [Betaproteobacteria bacterium]
MRAGSAFVLSARHIVGVSFQALLVAAIIAALAFAGSTVVGTAPGGANSVLAAKGGNGNGTGGGHGNGAGGTTTASITVPDGPFGGTTTASTNVGGGVWVQEVCIANDGGALVDYRSTDSNGQAVLQLGPTPTWSSGAASCTASLGAWNGNGNWEPTASTTFNAY